MLDVKKPLIDSNSLKTFASDPTGLGKASNFKSKTFSNIIEDIIISAFFPAVSSRYVLVNLNPKSTTYTKTTPKEKIHKVSNADVGITLS